MIDFTNLLDFYKERDRLTNNCNISCIYCPFSHHNNSTGDYCNYFIADHPEKAVEILQKWSNENPPKTRAEDFRERFPNATEKYYLNLCPMRLGYMKECYAKFCGDKPCWNQSV